MGISVSVGDRSFPTKTAALAHFKQMLARYSWGDIPNDADQKDLRDLVSRHPESERIIGVGIDHIFVEAPEQQNQKCFWVKRLDNSNSNFSYRTAVTQKHNTLLSMFKTACRTAIEPITHLHKKQYFGLNSDANGLAACEVTGRLLKFSEADVDHAPPTTFTALVSGFIADNDLTPDMTMLTVNDDQRSVTEFVDMKLKQRFIDYHNSLAILRVTCANANRAQFRNIS